MLQELEKSPFVTTQYILKMDLVIMKMLKKQLVVLVANLRPTDNCTSPRWFILQKDGDYKLNINMNLTILPIPTATT